MNIDVRQTDLVNVFGLSQTAFTSLKKRESPKYFRYKRAYSFLLSEKIALEAGENFIRLKPTDEDLSIFFSYMTVQKLKKMSERERELYVLEYNFFKLVRREKK